MHENYDEGHEYDGHGRDVVRSHSQQQKLDSEGANQSDPKETQKTGKTFGQIRLSR